MNVRHDFLRIGLLAVSLAVLLPAARSLRARAPAPLTLLFTADEYGYLEPCG